MSSITKKFEILKAENKLAFIPYITAGYPNLSFTKKMLLEFNKLQVAMIEIGIPFSDSLADGPTIQKSFYSALSQQITLKKIFDFVKEVRNEIAVPLILMGSYNLFYKYGVDKTIFSCNETGVDGLIIPDLPPEEADKLISSSKNIDIIFLLSPTSSKERIKLVAKKTRGFIYYISVTGVTGARNKLPVEIKYSLKKIKKYTNLPICVGFGISKQEQVKMLRENADGIIIGSAIINLIEKNKDENKAIKKVVNFFESIMK